MSVRRLAACAALALSLAACSGDDDAAPATLPPPVTDPTATSTTSTVPPPTTPETTEPAPETSPPTLPAEPTTTESPTPPDEEAIKQDVIDATIASWTALNDVKLDPADDELLARLAESRVGLALDRVVEFVAELRALNRRSVTHPTAPAEIVVLPTSIVIVAPDTVTVEYCWLDSNTLVEIGASEDGTDLVVNDSVSASHDRERYSLVDGRWLKADGQVVETYEDLAKCIAANSL